jgi:Ca2+-binding RTX toxin-like protein
MAWVIMALFGAGLLAAFIGDDDDPVADTEVEPPPPPPPPPGEDFELADGDSVTGTAGDDSFHAGPDVTLNIGIVAGAGHDSIDVHARVADIDTGSGDDTITLRGTAIEVFGRAGDDTIDGGSQNSLLDGGAGDDAITSDQFENTLNGGTGDDTLVADRGHYRTRIEGDEGDDLLMLDMTGPGYQAEQSWAFGGDGDDILRADVDLGNDGPGTTADPFLDGGAGADRFEIAMYPETQPDDSARTFEGTVAFISDFDPDEDMLVVDTNTLAADGTACSLESFVIRPHDANSSLLRIRMENAATGKFYSGDIIVRGVADLQPEDVIFADLTPIAAA